jgi:hypothetical protein
MIAIVVLREQWKVLQLAVKPGHRNSMYQFTDMLLASTNHVTSLIWEGQE